MLFPTQKATRRVLGIEMDGTMANVCVERGKLLYRSL